MRFILFSLFSLLTLVNSFTLPRRSSIRNKCFDDEIIYLKNKIGKLRNIKNKMLILTEQNLKNIKEIVEEEYSTEWDYYNRTWLK